MNTDSIKVKTICAHCGDNCNDSSFYKDDKHFCCSGCKMVYEMLQDNGMSDYYLLQSTPGTSLKKDTRKEFEYLDNNDIIEKLLQFKEGTISKVEFDIPQIHCSSCLWLLENISKLQDGILKSHVNFGLKKVRITFNHDIVSLKQLAELLSRIGYEPRIHFDSLNETKAPTPSLNKKMLYKLGLAGFCFGNIMLLSFQEYLGSQRPTYYFTIGIINIILSLPVLFYAGFDYLKSAYLGLRMKQFNINLPIALGMLALFGRSVFEILSRTGEGYLDSFTGFVFFLLIGRWFQKITYKALNFDRTYKSYFPIATSVFVNNKWTTKSINLLEKGDIIRVRNEELIPADCILKKGKARIDYSFVTGESILISKSIGEEIFAGGRHLGESVELEVTKGVDQSYLTQLWNEDTFKKKHDLSQSSKLIDGISKYFTFIILAIASLTFLYWLYHNPAITFNTFTAVLIVACPCALALALPFAYGNILRLLSSRGFFLRNVETIENIQDIDYVIFDKTGTITDSKKIQINYIGISLSQTEKVLLKSSCSHSSHPLSKAIVEYYEDISCIDIDTYKEDIGQGFTANCQGKKIKIGSSNYIFKTDDDQSEKGVFVEIDNIFKGRFEFKHSLRNDLEIVIDSLSKSSKIAILSGDSNHEEERLRKVLGSNIEMFFNQSPKDKLSKIKSLQDKGFKVMMIGDGLNDAGALKQSNVGLVIADKNNNFSPACDGIIDADRFDSLHHYIRFLKNAKYIIYGAFVLAFFYNFIGLSFAVTGHLTPIIAAILMPLSSITVIVYGVLTSWINFELVKNKTKTNPQKELNLD